MINRVKKKSSKRMLGITTGLEQKNVDYSQQKSEDGSHSQFHKKYLGLSHSL